MAGLFDDIVSSDTPAPSNGGMFGDIVAPPSKPKGLLSSVANSFKGAGARMAQGVNESLGSLDRAFGMDQGAKMYQENADYWKRKAEESGSDGIASKIYEGIGESPAGVAEFMGGVPFAAVKGAAQGYQKDGLLGAATGAATEGVKRFGVGKVFHGLENTGLGGMTKAAAMGGTMGAQTAAEQYGATGEVNPEDVAASTATGAFLSLGHSGEQGEVRRNLMKEGVDADIANDLSSRAPMTLATARERLRKPTVGIPDTGIADPSMSVDDAIKSANAEVDSAANPHHEMLRTIDEALKPYESRDPATITPAEQDLIKTLQEQREKSRSALETGFTLQGQPYDKVEPEAMEKEAPKAIGYNAPVYDTEAVQHVEATPVYDGVMVEPRKQLPEPVIDTTAEPVREQAAFPAPEPVKLLPEPAAAEFKAEPPAVQGELQPTRPVAPNSVITQINDIAGKPMGYAVAPHDGTPEGIHKAAMQNARAAAAAHTGSSYGETIHLATDAEGKPTSTVNARFGDITPLEKKAPPVNLAGEVSHDNGREAESVPATVPPADTGSGARGVEERAKEPAKEKVAAKEPWEMTQQEWESAADKGKIHQATGKSLPGENAAKTPIKIGEINGYTPEDIAHFYVTRDGADGYGHYISDAIHEGKHVPDAIMEQVFSDKGLKKYKKIRDSFDSPSPLAIKAKELGKKKAAVDDRAAAVAEYQKILDRERPVEAPATPVHASPADKTAATRGVLATLAKPKTRSAASLAKLSEVHGRDTVNELAKSGLISFPGKGMAELTKKGKEWLEANPAPRTPAQQERYALLSRKKKLSEKEQAQLANLAAMVEPEKSAPSHPLANERGSAPIISDILDSIRQTRTFQDLRASVHELGAHLYEKGMEFKEFAGRMKETLSDMWLKGSAFVKGAYEYAKGKLSDERGLVGPDINAPEPGKDHRDLTPISDQFRIVKEAADKLSKFADRSKFIKSDVKPAIDTAIEGTNIALDGINRAINPMARSKAAETAGRILIEGMGKKAHGVDDFKGELNRAIEDYNQSTGVVAKTLDLLTNSTGLIADKVFNTMPEKERIAFMQAMDTGEKQATPQLQAIADTVKKMYDKKVAAIQALGNGMLENVRDSYFPHIWEKGEDAAKQINMALSKRPLDGTKSFNKHRVFDTIQEGLDAGYKLVSTNPMDLVFLKMHEMDKYLNAHTALQAMEGSGVVDLIPAGDRVPDGFTDIAGRYGTVVKHEFVDPTTGEVTSKNYRYVARDDVAQVFNNYLSKGLYHNPYVGKAYSAYMGAANTLNQFQLGVFSAFHAGFTSMEAVISHAALGVKAVAKGDFKGAGKYLAEAPAAWYTNPKLGDKIVKAWMGDPAASRELPHIVQWLEMAGARKELDNRFRDNSTQKMMQAWNSGNKVGAMVRGIPSVVEQSARPIMEWLVPRQKFGVFGEMANDWYQRNPNATHEEMRTAMQKIWNRVDSRLGQVNYDRLFTHAVTKNLVQALIRAPGWTGGTILEVGGGMKDLAGYLKNVSTGRKAELSERAAYTLSMVMTTAIVNGALTYAFTGQSPQDWKDLVAFRTGNTDERGNPERFMLPTYMKDVYAYASDIASGSPFRTLGHKTHPLISMSNDLVHNRDYYGTEIRHEGDNPIAQLGQMTGYVAKAFVPFWIRGLQKEVDRGGSGSAMAAPFIGVMPAPADMNRTKAEKLARDLMVARMPQTAKTKEDFERGQLIAKLTNSLRKGEEDASSKISEAVSNGDITPKQAHNIRQNARLTPIEVAFKKLGYEEARKVMEAANDEEKAKLEKMFRTKARNYKLSHPRNNED